MDLLGPHPPCCVHLQAEFAVMVQAFQTSGHEFNSLIGRTGWNLYAATLNDVQTGAGKVHTNHRLASGHGF
jgi:hypothetical protein